MISPWNAFKNPPPPGTTPALRNSSNCANNKHTPHNAVIQPIKRKSNGCEESTHCSRLLDPKLVVAYILDAISHGFDPQRRNRSIGSWVRQASLARGQPPRRWPRDWVVISQHCSVDPAHWLTGALVDVTVPRPVVGGPAPWNRPTSGIYDGWCMLLLD